MLSLVGRMLNSNLMFKASHSISGEFGVWKLLGKNRICVKALNGPEFALL